jgi:hypothetical protein
MAAQRLDALVNGLPAARQRNAAGDSTRQSRQRPYRHAVADFAGTYENEAFGAVTFSVVGGALRYRWGVLDGHTEVFDADKDQVRIEVANSGNVLAFQFAREIFRLERSHVRGARPVGFVAFECQLMLITKNRLLCFQFVPANSWKSNGGSHAS